MALYGSVVNLLNLCVRLNPRWNLIISYAMLAQAFLEAHDSEILGLDWAHSPQPGTAPSAAGDERSQPGLMLASAGRDGFVHLFRGGTGASAGCDGLLAPLDTLDDHGGAAVAAARFGVGGSRLVTCGGDRSVVVRALSIRAGGAVAGAAAPAAVLLRRAALSAADCAVECGAAGRRTALAAREGGLVVLDTKSGAELCRWKK
jgi:hypothetical protein